MTVATFISLIVLAAMIAVVYVAYRWIAPSLRNIPPGKGGIETDYDLHASNISSGSGDTGGHSSVWRTPKQK